MKKTLSILLSFLMISTCFTGMITAQAASKINKSEAKAIALQDAGLKSSQVKFTKNKLDYDNGIKIYDIEFYTNLTEYEYEINASTGKIVSRDSDLDICLSTKTYIYNGKAKKPSVTIKTDDGRSNISSSYYKVTYKNNTKPGKATATIKFNDKKYHGTFKKNFTIKPKKSSLTSIKKNGTNLTVKWKKDNNVTGYQVQYSTNSNFSSSKKVTVSKKSTTSKTIKGLKSNKKYYVRVRAYKTVNGKKFYGPYSAKKSIGKNASSSSASAKLNGKEKAKSIALKDAGLKSSKVTFTKVKLDYDDGIEVYDIEFHTSIKEYEYEINASTWKIIERSVENYNDD
ncbi:MAG: PepSY domain-containing protein [Acetobacter sp.]|nr:PepSY domain-containing protein [Bacteroides sp.]MCM1341028.1 PepSY domain-containing protein [Acetobacter sp.]MCM1432416.1 PepSY domain-containing protein [Clostridiales bacterium]